jgi:U5 small nuclear ribonucleoprotein component
MDPDFYDEFGNYIGPELASDSEDENDYGNAGDDIEDRDRSDDDMDEDKDENRENMDTNTMAVVLHEDKRYYPSALEVYGPDVSIICSMQ